MLSPAFYTPHTQEKKAGKKGGNLSGASSG